MISRIARWFRKDSGTANPQSWLVDILGGKKTTAGIGVNSSSALKCTAVFACVRVVSEDVAKLPLKLQRRLPNGGREDATDHPLFSILFSKPNDWQSSFEWREMMQAHIELRGNAYSYISRNARGDIESLIPLHPDRVLPVMTEDGGLFYQIQGRTVDGFTVGDVRNVAVVPDSAILHVRGLSLNGPCGVSPITYAAETIGLSLAAEQHGAAFFGNSARPDVALIAKGNATLEQLKLIRDRWEENYRGANRAFKAATLPMDMEIKQLGLSNKDSQLLELRQFQVADIARIYRIPSHKINDLTRSTNNNIEHQGLEYYIDGLMPRLERFEAAMMCQLLTVDEAREYEIQFDFRRVLRGDMKSLMDAIAVGRQWGLLSINDGREWLNLNPIDGGDGYLVPLNMVPLGMEVEAARSNSRTPDETTRDALRLIKR